MSHLTPLLAALLAVLLLAAACTSDEEPVLDGSVVETSGPEPGVLPTEPDVLVEGLDGPTQIAVHPDGRLLVAEVGEGEGTPTGRITAIDLADTSVREVLVDGLDTPTGVTAADSRIWIVERDRLSFTGLEGGEPVVVFDDMPSNGRSNGTITTLLDESVVFDTSGALRGDEAVPGSATLWRLDPEQVADDGSTTGLEGAYGEPILTGMKHAYAVDQLEDGRLAVTEMSDGTYDGQPAPDEVLLIDPDVDGLTGGWPRCVGDGVPVEEHGGDEEVCAEAVASLATFPPGATPTGVLVRPEGETLLVTLWTRDEIVEIPLPGADADAGDPPTVVVDGIVTPQHMVALDDEVLVSSFERGAVLRLPL